MPYTDLIKRAFNTVRREPALWVLGIILALFGGGSGGGGSNFNTGTNNFGDITGGQDFETPAWFNEETLVTIGLALACLVIVLAIVSLFVRGVALAGLIHGADRASTGEDVHWRDLWRAGWSQRGRRIVGLNFLLAIPTLLVFLILGALLLVAIIPLLQAADAADTNADLSTFFGSIIAVGVGIFCLVALLSVLSWLLTLIGNYAARAIVLEDRPVRDALRYGWQLFRQHVADSMIFSIMLGVIGVVVGFIIGLLFLVVAVAVGLPLFFFWRSQDFALPLGLLLGVPALLLISILQGVLYGPLVAFFETSWTVAWRHLTTPPAAPLEPVLEVPLL